MHHARVSRVTLWVVCLAVSFAQAGQEPTPLLVEGDSVIGVGFVTRIDNVAVNNSGVWLVEADTDNADTNSDSVLIRSGMLFFQENQLLAMPVGATLDSFDSVNINNNGDGGFNFFLNSDLPSSEDSGVYINGVLIIQESDISTAPEFSPGTPYIGFFDVKNNDVSQLLVVASIDDPAISSSVDRALVIVLVDGSNNLVSESVFAKEGDILPMQSEPVDDFGTGPHQSAINNFGQLLFFANLAGSTSTDGVIYLDSTVLAQEGFPSPVTGRNFQFLSSRGMDLNNVGDTVFKANLDGDTSDDDLLIVNNTVFQREGDTLPAIAPFLLTSFGTGSGPVQIDDNGNVLWFGDWDDTDTDVDTGLFLNDNLLVQEGVTTIGGVVVDTISSGSDAFEMSDDGRFIIFEATLEDGVNGAFMIEIADGENQPPVAVCMDVTVNEDGTCTADANVDGGSFDPDGDPLAFEQSPAGPYPVGTTEVTLTVSDGQGGQSSCTANVTVLDITSPTLTVMLDPDSLWPPNHRMVEVNATVDAFDLCSTPAVTLTSVTSSESDNGTGDGNTVNDIQDADIGEADFTISLRAERSGTGDGRVYTVVYTATDASGNDTSASATVVVPHDKNGVVEPVAVTVSKEAAGTGVSWTAVPEAQYYNVVRGRLSEIQITADAIDLGNVKCMEGQSVNTNIEGFEDDAVPEPGEVFVYVVEYNDGSGSGYGTESAPKPRKFGVAGCD